MEMNEDVFDTPKDWDTYYADMNGIYHDGFEDGIKFVLNRLYPSPVSDVEVQEWAGTLALFRRWKNKNEWAQLLGGVV